LGAEAPQAAGPQPQQQQQQGRSAIDLDDLMGGDEQSAAAAPPQVCQRNLFHLGRPAVHFAAPVTRIQA